MTSHPNSVIVFRQDLEGSMQLDQTAVNISMLASYVLNGFVTSEHLNRFIELSNNYRKSERALPEGTEFVLYALEKAIEQAKWPKTPNYAREATEAIRHLIRIEIVRGNNFAKQLDDISYFQELFVDHGPFGSY